MCYYVRQFIVKLYAVLIAFTFHIHLLYNNIFCTRTVFYQPTAFKHHCEGNVTLKRPTVKSNWNRIVYQN